VQHFFGARPDGAAWPGATRAAAPGPGTAAALRAQGLDPVEPAADAPAFDSEALWQRLRQDDWTGARVLVVRGEDGRDWLADQLRAAGASVHFVAAYARRPPEPDAAQRRLLAQACAAPESHLWLFSSSEAVANLRALAPAADWSRSAAAASHPRIAQAARAAGFGRVDLVAPRPADVSALIDGWPAGAAPIESGHQ